jgi:sugar phosphate isomerase/epimerase
LKDTEGLKEFRRAVESRGPEISALSCHGNPFHPDKDIARAHDEDFRDAVRLAAELGVERVVTFSGCPGDSGGSKRLNWVTGCCTRALRAPRRCPVPGSLYLVLTSPDGSAQTGLVCHSPARVKSSA